MANWRSLGKAFWAVDGALGGQRRPTRTQKWAARHPIGLGFCVAIPLTLLLLMLSREEEPDDPVFAVFAGLAMGLVFALSAVLERLRQRRLRRLGMWDGS
ncbi:hypothetical protein OG381_45030 [Streptomyces sp. NBC_00490]|uniref:hypothetical protein n=1 Tax=Streptomyces sp. NBC_00490 TaxID=2903657 RepID=UPI002E192DD2